MLKVSVVVPAYNTGRYVDECAPSLLSQSLGPDEYEVIYVDDGSTDDTLARLQKVAAENPRPPEVGDDQGHHLQEHDRGLCGNLLIAELSTDE
jgi:glycosyltransferase involved in cell wall biosynthesis